MTTAEADRQLLHDAATPGTVLADSTQPAPREKASDWIVKCAEDIQHHTSGEAQVGEFVGWAAITWPAFAARIIDWHYRQYASTLEASLRELQSWKESAMRQLGEWDKVRVLVPDAKYLGWAIQDAVIDQVSELQVELARCKEHLEMANSRRDEITSDLATSQQQAAEAEARTEGMRALLEKEARRVWMCEVSYFYDIDGASSTHETLYKSREGYINGGQCIHEIGEEPPAHQPLEVMVIRAAEVDKLLSLPATSALAQPRPRVVCLCGSTRFYTEFQKANYRETMAGRIVLSVGFYPHAQDEAHGEQCGVTPEQKVALDELHKRKIDLADEVLVLNVEGYIGDSTRGEIEHAKATGKPIRYLEPSPALERTAGEGEEPPKPR